MKTRFFSLAAVVLTTSLIIGCGGGEAAPDESATPQVDEAEIQKQIEEGMKMGGYSEQGQATAEQ